jgi:hypothetical protein
LWVARAFHLAKAAGGAEFVAVCDAWDVRRREAAAYLEKELLGPKVEQYADYRRVLERKDVDAVIVASTDHWHSRMTVDALHAGKDVFCEKPMTSLPEQGLEVVKAVRATGKLVQVGVQQRSIDHFIEAKQRFFDSGMIGPVHLVRTYWNANSGYLTPVPPGMESKPEGLDWQAVLGWLPKRPWNPKMYFNRFAYWEFSTGGQTGGLFVHMVDVVHSGDWPVPRSDSARGTTQAARVASVSAASGSFEDFTSGGVPADAKSSKFTTGASTPRAKICWRSRLRRSSNEGRAAWRRHFGSGR